MHKFNSVIFLSTIFFAMLQLQAADKAQDNPLPNFSNMNNEKLFETFKHNFPAKWQEMLVQTTTRTGISFKDLELIINEATLQLVNCSETKCINKKTNEELCCTATAKMSHIGLSPLCHITFDPITSKITELSLYPGN